MNRGEPHQLNPSSHSPRTPMESLIDRFLHHHPSSPPHPHKSPMRASHHDVAQIAPPTPAHQLPPSPWTG